LVDFLTPRTSIEELEEDDDDEELDPLLLEEEPPLLLDESLDDIDSSSLVARSNGRRFGGRNVPQSMGGDGLEGGGKRVAMVESVYVISFCGGGVCNMQI
jgi:hypothetical protein